MKPRAPTEQRHAQPLVGSRGVRPVATRALFVRGGAWGTLIPVSAKAAFFPAGPRHRAAAFLFSLTSVAPSDLCVWYCVGSTCGAVKCVWGLVRSVRVQRPVCKAGGHFLRGGEA